MRRAEEVSAIDRPGSLSRERLAQPPVNFSIEVQPGVEKKYGLTSCKGFPSI